ncbi:phosphotransferase system EIIB protein [Vibrio diazotrophicus]|uniref:PTS system N-acetylmuramic acid-specific EIIBC component n=1 Tax=Vibrio diazotrophicus TaxID=685 RepID=A0A329EH11_VIBDI|nr:phosphotransferase system EIIB protein [Vibrio diazotrophicus]
MAKITETMISQILSAVGGSSNVSKCGNCMTRLRLTLANNAVAEQAAIKQIPGVLGVVESDEQFQIILGPGKAQQAADLMNQLIDSLTAGGEAPAHQDLSSIAAEQKKQVKSKQTSSVQRFLSKFATIFTPLIPGFIAAGLLLGFATLLEQIFVIGQEPSQFMVDLIAYMKVFGKGLFAFLSILIGYNAQQAFGGSGVNGAILASLFVLGYNPEATSGIYSGMSEFFGYTIDPRGNIIGVLLAAIVGAQVERRVRRYMPDDLDMILTSVVTLLIMGVVTYVVIMPIGGELFKGMSWLFLNLNDNPLGAAILAGLFLISVVFGIHQGFVPVRLGQHWLFM